MSRISKFWKIPGFILFAIGLAGIPDDIEQWKEWLRGWFMFLGYGPLSWLFILLGAVGLVWAYWSNVKEWMQCLREWKQFFVWLKYHFDNDDLDDLLENYGSKVEKIVEQKIQEYDAKKERERFSSSLTLNPLDFTRPTDPPNISDLTDIWKPKDDPDE